MKGIYFDNAATTAVRPAALEAMLPYFKELFQNPSSLYSESDDARKAMADARATCAEAIGAKPEEIFFTGGGSEGDNWVIKGTAWTKGKARPTVITSAIEHHAVLHSVEFLKKQGFNTIFLPCTEDGTITPEILEQHITDDTCLVSIMFANNEVGTIQPIKELAEVAHKHGALFHTDAVQAVGHVALDVKDLGVDFLTAAGHKFGGPKGVGFAYIRKGLRIENLIHGGGQERYRRAGTENVAGIVGMAAALKEAIAEMPEENARLQGLRDQLIDGLLSAIPHSRLNGSRTHRLPSNVNLSFVGIEGETMLFDLEDNGFCCSTGSACASASLDPSHVLMAMGLAHEWAHGSVRLTLGPSTTQADVDSALKILPPIVARRREMSPLWHSYLAEQKEGNRS